MSKYDNASLVQIPSGYKAGTLYSVLPANGDGDFDFERNSIATRVNAEGLIETVAVDVPRLDYPILNGVVQSCPALLLEPARTNLTSKSNDFTLWTNISSVTNNANSVISPDGTQNASNIEFGATGTSKLFYDRVNVLLGQVTSSIYLKGAGTIKIYMEQQGGGYFAEKTITLTQSWARYDISVNATSDSVVLFVIARTSSNTATEVDIYGAQIEQGSYATSYIPTSGSAVTRAAEVCNGAGTSAEFNDSEGVLFAEISALANDGSSRFISLKSSATDIIRIGYIPTSNRIEIQNYKAGVSFNTFNYQVQDVEDDTKVAFKYKDNDFQLYINGLNVLSNTSVTSWSGVVFDKLQFDQHNGSNNFYGKTKQLIAFNAALTDEQLEDLTSWDSFIEMAQAQQYLIY